MERKVRRIEKGERVNSGNKNLKESNISQAPKLEGLEKSWKRFFFLIFISRGRGLGTGLVRSHTYLSHFIPLKLPKGGWQT